MARKFWSFRAAADPGVGELLLYGFIGADDGMSAFFDEITPKQFKEDLDALGDIGQLNVFINSEGGDVFAGQAIHSILKRHKAQKSVFIDGIAASIASVVAMAGDIIIMPRNAMMMIHNPWTIAVGDAGDFRKVADNLDQIRESIVVAYQSKNEMPREELLALLEAETWMTADEALDMGFADQVDEAKAVEASMLSEKRFRVNGRDMDLSKYRKAPQFAHLTEGVTQSKDSYTKHAASVLAVLSEFESRTMDRLAAREKGQRQLSDADLQRWEQVRDAATRVLAKAAAGAPASGLQDEAGQLFAEFQKLKARMNGVPI